MELDALLKTASALVAGAAGAYQWSSMRHRNKLKADLEILQLYASIDPSSEHCSNLRQRIDKRMARAYPTTDITARTDLDKSDLFMGLLFLFGTLVLVFYAKSQPTTNQLWYYTAAGVLGLAGGTAVYKGVERKVDHILRRAFESSAHGTGSGPRHAREMVPALAIQKPPAGETRDEGGSTPTH